MSMNPNFIETDDDDEGIALLNFRWVLKLPSFPVYLCVPLPEGKHARFEMKSPFCFMDNVTI